MICEICRKEFADSRIGSHITRTHKMTIEQYYLTYIGTKGKCLTCGKDTRFKNIRGYARCCSNKYVGLNQDMQAHKKATTRLHFGVDWSSRRIRRVNRHAPKMQEPQPRFIIYSRRKRLCRR